MYARGKVRLPKALQTRGLEACFRRKFGNLGARKCHFLGFTRNIFEEKCNSCLILFSSVIGKVQYVWKKRSNSDAIKEVTSKEQNVYPSGPSCLEAGERLIRVKFNPGFFFLCSKVFSGIILSVIFRASNHQLVKKN